MRCSIRRFSMTSVCMVSLWLFFTLKFPREIEDDPDVMAIKGQVSRSKGSTDQTALENWNDLLSKHTKNAPQSDRKWLTVGISSGSWAEGSNLLATLDSLFRASSEADQEHFTVLVHLADSDLTWLNKTVDSILNLFSSQILARQLLLIHAPPDVYPTVAGTREDDVPREFYSKQNVDHAFLMSYAANLSDYFLLLADNVFCGPKFVDHIQWEVTKMKSRPWVLLEFSNMGFLGKLFHSRDLPLLAQFLLLFHAEKPLERLIPHFCALSVPKKPILCRPFLFHPRASYMASDGNESSAVKAKDSHGPDNPPGTIFTDMSGSDVHFPWQAYSLEESFFWTSNVSVGNHLTVLLSRSVNLRRVQVLTGSTVDGEGALERGQVELGYGLEGVPQYCSKFILLGQLLEGQLDQEVFPKTMRQDVNCVRLVVKASQVGGLMIRHIYLWEEKAQMEERQR